MKKKLYKTLLITALTVISVAFLSCAIAYFLHRKSELGAQYTFVSFLGETFSFYIIYGVLVIACNVIFLYVCDAWVKPFSKKIEGLQEQTEYEELNVYIKALNVRYFELKTEQAEKQRYVDEIKTISSNINQGLLLLDKGGQITLMNNYLESLIGMDSNMVVGQHYSITKYSKIITALIKKANFGEVAESLLEEDNVSYQFALYPSKTYGEIKGYVLLIFDVTDKEKLEAQRREFTANVSHELKTPLHSISGAAELLCSGMVKEQDVGTFASQIYTETKRMITLTEDIIKLSSLDENAQNGVREQVNLKEIALTVADLLKSEAEKSSVSIEVNAEDVLVRGIKQLLTTILYNLCENAIKYNKVGGNVKLTVKKKDNRVEIIVKDNGIGIPHEHHSRIFERFYRVDKSHSKEVGGTGLGLSIVKHAVRLHSGEIKVKSQVGKGTSFTVKLPIVEN